MMDCRMDWLWNIHAGMTDRTMPMTTSQKGISRLEKYVNFLSGKST